jgi:hypothetical protein
VRAPDGGGVRVPRVGGEVEDVPVSAGRQHDRVADERLDLSRDQVARDNPAGAAVDDQEVQHLRVWMHFHRAASDLPLERLIRAQQQLLASLAARIKRP